MSLNCPPKMDEKLIDPAPINLIMCPECGGECKMMAYKPYCKGPCYEAAMARRPKYVVFPIMRSYVHPV